MSEDNFDAKLEGAIIGTVSYAISRLSVDLIFPDLDIWLYFFTSIVLIAVIIIMIIVVDIIRIKGNIREMKKETEERRRKRLENL